MATFESFKDFGSAFEAMTKEIEQDRKLWALEMAKRAEAIGKAEATADLGADLKFSHWAPRWDTRIKPTSTGAVLLPTRSGAGVITVANQGRHNANASGFAGPGINKKTGLTKKLKSGGVGKVKAVKGKRWNGSTRGMGTADRAVARMERELYSIAEKGLTRTQMRHFDID